MRYWIQVCVVGVCLIVAAISCGPTESGNCQQNQNCLEASQENAPGDGGTTTDFKVGNPEALRWNQASSGTTADLWGVSVPTETDAWVVGSQGTILRTKDRGATWTKQKSGVTETLRAVSFVSAAVGWAVGDKGTVLHTKDGGATWTKLDSPVLDTLWGVQFLDQKTGFAVGDGFSLLRTTNGGQIWSPTSFRLEIDLNHLFFFDAKKGYVAGASGTVLLTNDGALNVSTETTAADQHVRALFFFNEEDGWAVGDSGQLLRKTKGTNWTRPASGVDSGLRGIWFANAQRGWVVGKYGVILGTTDGGAKWQAEHRLRFPDLHSIAGTGSFALIVGKQGTILRQEEIKDECTAGQERDCYDGPDGSKGVGRCAGGKQRCVQGIWGVCEGQVLPADKEICFNNQDDNCNAKTEIEDGCPVCKENDKRDCYTGPDGTVDVGLCSKGEQYCRNGKWDVCEDQVVPTAEKCNGSDDDCDGKVDNDPKDPPNCDQAIGVCATAKKVCKDGKWAACEASQFGSDYQQTEDKCDGKDNDCDGTIDENCPCTKDGESRTCYGGPQGSAGQGACVEGKQTCQGGKWTECVGEIKPSAEICDDQKDNDCDGKVDEKTQYALLCNGSWSYASVPHHDVLEPTDAMTLEGWFKIDYFPTRTSISLLSKSERGGYAIQITNTFRNRNISFRVWPKGGRNFAEASAKVSDFLKTGEWHHIAGTFDKQYLRLWIDGKKAAETALSDAIQYNTNNVPLVFGAEASANGVDPRAGNYLNGQIAQVRISSKALYDKEFTPDCVLAKTADTIGLWLLEEGTGDVIREETGQHQGKWNGPGWAESPRCPGFAQGGGCQKSP